MISVIVLTRNAPRLTDLCLQSLRATSGVLNQLGGGVEFILADDCSDEDRGIVPMLRDFQSTSGHPTTVVRFRRHQHYAHALAYTMSLARGDNVLFISHDMQLTSHCVATLLELATDPRIGVIRPSSGHMDYARPLAVSPPSAPQTYADVDAFSHRIRRQHRTIMMEVPILIGDAMLIKRATLDRIGVFDTRFHGLLADVDYGVRVQRAGLMIVVARGAWLHHDGGGAGKETAASGGKSVLDNEHDMVRQVLTAYEAFRDKWGPTLPDQWRDVQPSHLKHLRALPAPAGGDFQPPLELGPDFAEVL